MRVSPGGDLPNSASADGWAFGWKFYHEEASPEQNVFFSPYSISTACGMLVAGAAGQTKSEIDTALSFSGNTGADFHQARNSVSQALAQRNHAATQERQAQTLRVSNDLWLQPDFRPTAEFLNTLSAYYGASTFLAPFDTDPEASRLAINDKVASDTEQLIQELLPEGSIDRAVAFVLTNAMYFKARWESEFSKDATADEPFLTASGEQSVPMMHGYPNGRHYAGSDYEAIALPYFGRELELVAIMPPAGTFDSFVDSLTAQSVSTALSRLTGAALDLRFPKFGIQSDVPLKERLRALGMQQAFQPGAADFSPLSPTPVYISDAFHQAVLSIDEEGTTAAAATALVARDESEPQFIQVVFDHPFVFFIRDVQTDALLFVGHFATP